ncbi:hypothetical protein [Acinetobacter calcoaceticus]|uniref:hypothetical protein n=1 Tax=Acinetobacter calcoaceticus TaxID=471 RepID=UPI00227606C0|nr:hypothetical protein [Acinetobacter calcoaceticus]GLG84516.1 hypothetical protein ACSO1_30400 [Acinetobacter calcoaceticus]
MKKILISLLAISAISTIQAKEYPNYADEKKYLQMLEKVYPQLEIIVRGKLILNNAENDIKALADKDKKEVCSMANAVIKADNIIVNNTVHESYFESTNYLQNFMTSEGADNLKQELQLSGFKCD